MRKLLLFSVFVGVTILLSSSVLLAGVPTLVSYQGELSDSTGTPLDTTVSMTFAIYDDAISGVSVWTETQPSVEVSDGFFHVLLGSVMPVEDTVFNSDERWLGVTVGGGAELEPRTRIVSGAYAQRVSTVDGATGGDISGRTRIVKENGDFMVTLREGPTSGAGQVITFDSNGEYNTLLGTTTGNPDHGGIGVYDEFGTQKATLWIPNHGGGMVTTNGPNNSFNVRLSTLSGYPNNGYVAVRDSLDDNKVGIFVSSYGVGGLFTKGPNDSDNVRLTNLDGYFNNGYIAVRDSLNVSKVGIYASSYGNGRMYTMGPNGSQNIGMANWYYDQNNGFVAVFNNSDDLVSGVWAGDSGRGIVSVWGPNVSSNVHLTSLDDHPENGHVGVYDSTSYCQGALYIDSSNSGIVFTRGPNGNRNARLMYLEGYPNNGYVSVWDESDTIRAGMYVDSAGDGVIFADVKNFRMSNPANRNTEIWYACLEGPEAAAYVRGTAHLVNGQSVVTYEDHFASVASSEGLTIQLTPLSAESKGLAVVEKNSNGFVVAELSGGKGNYDFDFMVMSVRKGYEDYRVIRPVSEARPSAEELAPTPVDRENLIDRESPSEETIDMESVEANPVIR